MPNFRKLTKSVSECFRGTKRLLVDKRYRRSLVLFYIAILLYAIGLTGYVHSFVNFPENRIIATTAVVLGIAPNIGVIWYRKHLTGIKDNIHKITDDLRKGAILDWLLPPNEVDHRIIELEEGRDRWIEKYGTKRAKWLYIWQSVVTVALFWFDRVVVKFLVKRS